MNKFNLAKGVGYGILIWGIMSAVLWVLSSFQSINPLWAHGIVAAIGAISSYLFAINAKADNGLYAILYGLVWAAVVILLDLVIAQWFDSHLFVTWQYWLGAALVFLAPWVETETDQQLGHPA